MEDRVSKTEEGGRLRTVAYRALTGVAVAAFQRLEHPNARGCRLWEQGYEQLAREAWHEATLDSNRRLSAAAWHNLAVTATTQAEKDRCIRRAADNGHKRAKAYIRTPEVQRRETARERDLAWKLEKALEERRAANERYLAAEREREAEIERAYAAQGRKRPCGQCGGSGVVPCQKCLLTPGNAGGGFGLYIRCPTIVTCPRCKGGNRQPEETW